MVLHPRGWRGSDLQAGGWEMEADGTKHAAAESVKFSLQFQAAPMGP